MRIATGSVLLAGVLSTACGGGGGSGGVVADWYVSATTGTDAGAGTQADPFQTITHALTVALSGQTVAVAPGTYDAANGETFPIVVPADVTLLGDEANKGDGPVDTHVLGGGLAPPPNVGGILYAAVVLGSGAEVAGFRIQNVLPYVANQFPYGVALPESNATLRDNTVELSEVGGVYAFNGASNLDVRENVIQINVGFAGTGITFIGTGGANRVQGNVITENQYGVMLDSPTAADLGGGDAGSLGGNVISCNTGADLWVNAVLTIAARDNFWDHVAPTSSTTVQTGGMDVYNGGGSATIDTTGALLAPGACP
jgi:hypothetical protein